MASTERANDARRHSAADRGTPQRAHAARPSSGTTPGPNRASRGPGRKAAKPQPQAAPKRFTDAEIDEANGNLDRAFSVLGLIRDGHLVCPACGADKKGKVVYKQAKGYWKCYPCGAPYQDPNSKASRAIGLLTEFGGYKFIDAVNELLGRPSQGKPAKVVPTVKIERAHEFQAVVDSEVYDALLAEGSVRAAQKYFAWFHISPEVVAEVGCVFVMDPSKVMAELTKRFGRDRLVACGLVKAGEDGKRDYPMCNRDYPLIEPHRRPDGRVVGMQFRPSLKREAQYKAHVAYSKARKAAEAAGETFTGRKVDYVPKFISLVGGVPGQHIVGGGVPRLASLAPGASVYIVEGIKDLMAARTMGAEAYAIPGVGVMPPEKVCKILARHTAVICMDADEAGDQGAKNLEAWFTVNGVAFRHKSMADGLDVTDTLVERHAKAGCECDTCTTWRSSHPDAPETPVAEAA